LEDSFRYEYTVITNIIADVLQPSLKDTYAFIMHKETKLIVVQVTDATELNPGSSLLYWKEQKLHYAYHCT